MSYHRCRVFENTRIQQNSLSENHVILMARCKTNSLQLTYHTSKKELSWLALSEYTKVPGTLFASLNFSAASVTVISAM